MSQKDLDPALDGQLELKKRARRRLVGAAALAVLAAVVLPMVMDHEPRQPAQDVQVRIPSQDAGGFTSRILPAKPAPTPLPPATEPESKPVRSGETPASEAPPPESKRAEAPAAEIKPAASRLQEAKSVEPAKHAEKAPEKPEARTDEARAAAVLAGGSGDQWVVQLGAYKEAGNVKILLAKIKQMNLPVYTEDFASPQGPRVRVRAGPFGSKEAAEKAQSRIKTIGVTGPVAPK